MRSSVLSHRRSLACAAVAVACASGCGGDGPVTPNPVAVRVALVVAPPGTAPSGVPFSTQPVLQLQDASGAPVGTANVTVTAAVQGGTLVGTASVKTGSDGKAVFTDLGLGGAPGTRTLVFSAGTLQPANHPVTVVAGAAARIVATGPLNQPGLIGSPVPFPPAVKVVDAGGNPVAGFTVEFAIAGGGGSVAGASPTSGADGIATLGSWTLGPATGANTVTATATGLQGSPMTFSANGLQLMPTKIGMNGGNDQTAPINGIVPVAPSVFVTGFGGAPVEGVTVSFAVTAGGGVLTGADALTNASGIATVGSWALGSEVGANQLTATLAGVVGSPVVFDATATQTGAVTAIRPAEIALVGAVASPAPGVLVRDQDGDPVAGIAVRFTVIAGGGSVQGAEQVTGADGRAHAASWTFGPSAGMQQVRADVAPGYVGSPVVYTVHTVTNEAASIEIVAGNSQTVQVASQVPIRPSVRITDAGGQPVEGYPVRFSATFGTVTGGSVVTDADGIATVGSWTLPQLVGSYGLTAFSGIGDVAFTVTAVAGPATRLVPVREFYGLVGEAALPIMQQPAGVSASDAWGNAVAGVPVTFAPGAGPGPGTSVDGTPRMTNAQGLAEPVNWIFGTVPGNYELVASSPGLTSATIIGRATAGPPAAMAMVEGDGQSGGVRRLLPVDPTMKVTDRFGNATAGTVTFSVTGGGGSGGGAIPADAAGLAAAKWKLGNTPGANAMRATLDATGATYDFSATATAVATNFTIDVRFLSAPTAAQEAAFAAAAARWSDIILGDIPSFTANRPSGECFAAQPALVEVIDDVLIFVNLVSIDGVGGVLGSAGPCLARTSTLLPAMGVIQLDVADVNAMITGGEFGDVVLHEMGHVLGVGSLWELKNLTFAEGTPSVAYIGAAGVGQYRGMGGQLNSVPVENTGGVGTADSHWRESAFSNELMTGYIFLAGNPLTRMTIGSVQDLGYPSVDYGTADTLSFRPQLRTTSALRSLGEVPLQSPIRIVDDLGRVVAERPRVQ